MDDVHRCDGVKFNSYLNMKRDFYLDVYTILNRI